MGMMKIIPYSGIGMVGGNKFELSEGSTKIMLDFGRALGIEQLYRLSNMDLSELYRRISLGICPKIYGIYRNDLLAKTDIPHHKEVVFDGIVYSHSHLDHIGDMYLCDDDITHYVAPATFWGIKAYENVLRIMANTEFTYYRKKPNNGLPLQYFQFLGPYQLIPGKNGKKFEILRCNKAVLSRHPERNPTHEAQIMYNLIREEKNRKFVSSNKSTAGEFEIEFYPVNHSIADAQCILVKNKKKTVFYSGDMQGFTGRYRTSNIMTMERLKQERIDLAMVDCTRIEEDEVLGEDSVEEILTDYLQEAKGISFITFPFRDLKRQYTVLKACQRTGKILVTYPKSAIFLMYKSTREVLKEKYELSYNRDIYVYDTGTNFTSRQGNRINSYKRIIQIPDEEIDSDFVVHLHNLQVEKLTDFKIPEGSQWIHSQSGPYDEEGRIEKDKINNYLQKFNIRWRKAHTSGHMGFNDMQFMLKELNPKIIVPIHCDFANSLKLKKFFPDKTILFKIGEPFEF